MTIKEAKQYINFAISYGFASPEDFDGMTDEELISWVEYNGAKGDYYANMREKE